MRASNTFEANLARHKPTEERCEELIADEQYWQVPGTYMTVCALVLINGFTVTGESACATPEEFDLETGRSVARLNAKAKLISLECYALRDRLLVAGVMP